LFHLLEGITGFEKRDLLALEALLFLTMLLFHYDDGKRQTALYQRRPPSIYGGPSSPALSRLTLSDSRSMANRIAVSRICLGLPFGFSVAQLPAFPGLVSAVSRTGRRAHQGWWVPSEFRGEKKAKAGGEDAEPADGQGRARTRAILCEMGRQPFVGCVAGFLLRRSVRSDYTLYPVRHSRLFVEQYLPYLGEIGNDSCVMSILKIHDEHGPRSGIECFISKQCGKA
jgi:hypothetical protein